MPTLDYADLGSEWARAAVSLRGVGIIRLIHSVWFLLAIGEAARKMLLWKFCAASISLGMSCRHRYRHSLRKIPINNGVVDLQPTICHGPRDTLPGRLWMDRFDDRVRRRGQEPVDQVRAGDRFDLVPRSPLNSVQIPANANGGRFSLSANQTTSFFWSPGSAPTPLHRSRVGDLNHQGPQRRPMDS